MQCPMKTGRSSELALDYFSGRLDLEVAAELERHFGECRPCREYFTAGVAVRQALDDWEAPPVSPGFDRRLQERIAAEEAHRKWWKTLLAPFRPGVLKPAAAFAAVAVVLFAAVLLRMPGPAGPETASGGAEVIDVEQVEQAVEDLEMLYLLDPAALEEAPEAPVHSGPERIGMSTGGHGRKRCA